MLPYRPNCDSLPPLPPRLSPPDGVPPLSAGATGVLFCSLASSGFALETAETFAMKNFFGDDFALGVPVGVGRGFGFGSLGVTLTFGAADGLGEDADLGEGFGTGN